jgi:hypothetical protein
LFSLGAFPVKWLIIFLLVGVVAVFGWITLQDFRTLDPRTAVTKAAVVAYGHVVTSPRSHIVIDEIWKGSGSNNTITVGANIAFTMPQEGSDRALVCFSPRLLSRQLAPSAIFAVRSDSVGLPPVPLSELKALCAATPST